MGKLPNPNQDKPYQRVVKDQGGNELYGIRGEHTPDEEIVHIPSGNSNQTYYQPETVLDPSKCQHRFMLIDSAKREIECDGCGWVTAFHVGINLVERGTSAFVRLNGHEYPISRSPLLINSQTS